MFLTLYTYFVKSAYYVYFVTISYYCGCCSVKDKDIDNVLLSLEQQVTTAPAELKTKPLAYYHQRMVATAGTMQSQTSQWQKQHPNKKISFERQYRLQFLNKILAKELVNTEKNSKAILAKKALPIKDAIKKLIPDDKVLDLIVKEVMSFAYPSTYDCQDYLIKQHYLRLAQLTRLSCDYSPCYYLLTYSLLLFEWYYCIRGSLGMVRKKQFKKPPLRLYKPYKTIYYDMCSKTVNDLEKQINQLLSLCSTKTNIGNLKKGIEGKRKCSAMDTKNLSNSSNNLYDHLINKAWSIPLQKALITQNNTAVTLAIDDLSFHGIYKNDTHDYLLVPFVGSWLADQNNSLPLTPTHFCEQALFAPGPLANNIYDEIRKELQDSLDRIKTKVYNQVRQDGINYILCALPMTILVYYNCFRNLYAKCRSNTTPTYPIDSALMINQNLVLTVMSWAFIYS